MQHFAMLVLISILLNLFQAIVGLTMDGKLQQPKFDFDSEEVRYNHRFAPFGNLATPPPVQYAHFKVLIKCIIQFSFDLNNLE